MISYFLAGATHVTGCISELGGKKPHNSTLLTHVFGGVLENSLENSFIFNEMLFVHVMSLLLLVLRTNI